MEINKEHISTQRYTEQGIDGFGQSFLSPCCPHTKDTAAEIDDLEIHVRFYNSRPRFLLCVCTADCFHLLVSKTLTTVNWNNAHVTVSSDLLQWSYWWLYLIPFLRFESQRPLHESNVIFTFTWVIFYYNIWNCVYFLQHWKHSCHLVECVSLVGLNDWSLIWLRFVPLTIYMAKIILKNQKSLWVEG